MMRVTAMALTAVLGASLAAAQQPAGAPAQKGAESKPAAPKKPAKPAMSKYMGTVASVDAAAGKLTVKNKKGEMKEFMIGGEVKITKGGKTAALSEIMAGDSATVSYEGTAEAPMVKSVAAKAPKKQKKG